MKNRILIFLLLFILVVFAGTASSQNDTLFIQNLKIVPDTTVAGIQGVTLMFSIDYSYDTSYHKSIKPVFFSAKMEVLNNDIPVIAVSSTNSYKLENGHIGCDVFPNNRFKKQAFIHIPYYAMNLSAGEHDISFRFSASFNDPRSEEAGSDIVFVKHDAKDHSTVIIPEKEYFEVLVGYAEAYESDFDGSGWDYVFSDRLPPDLKWKVVAFGNDRNDFFYISSKERSSYTAEWSSYSNKICLSKGDKFHLLVVDNDPSYDDLIADICLSLDELMEISEKSEAFQVGRLSQIKISAQRLRE
ncbi:MAG: hypothetical protein JXR53_06130 [Bacteroidales bacterium]|nr:hypothetical protein [Bacteroidales bacterium]